MRRAAAALAGVGLALLLAELGLRLLDLPRDRGFQDATDAENLALWRERAGREGIVMAGQAHSSIYGWTNAPKLRDFLEPGHPPRSTNSNGLRGRREYARERGPESRLVLVGDSFTFGSHQPDGAIWAARLEAALDSTEVLNFGVPGFGIDQALLRLEEEALDWSPDVVIFGVFATNPLRATRRFTFYAKPRFELGLEGVLEPTPRGLPIPTPEALVRDPAAWLVPRGRGLRLMELLRRPTAEEASLTALTEALIDRAATGAAAGGARLLLVNIPTLRWRELAPEAWEQALVAVADRHAHVALLDLREAFARAEGRIYIPGRHFSPNGHGVVAAAIAERLAGLGWLSTAREKR